MVLRTDYEACGYEPSLTTLDSDMDFHVHALGVRIDEELPAWRREPSANRLLQLVAVRLERGPGYPVVPGL